jgi:hypothetical protein
MKLAFMDIYLQAGVPQLLEYCSHMLFVLFQGLAVNEDVI